jgi:hypothetical protein
MLTLDRHRSILTTRNPPRMLSEPGNGGTPGAQPAGFGRIRSLPAGQPGDARVAAPREIVAGQRHKRAGQAGRRARDSNPRRLAPQRFSRHEPATPLTWADAPDSGCGGTSGAQPSGGQICGLDVRARGARPWEGSVGHPFTCRSQSGGDHRGLLTCPAISGAVLPRTWPLPSRERQRPGAGADRNVAEWPRPTPMTVTTVFVGRRR